MNNTFQFNRFRLLLRKIWIENARIFGLGLLAVWGFGLFLYTAMGAFKGDMLFGNRIGIFMSGVIVVSTVLTNFLFRELANKQGSIAYLTQPTSSLEKILSVIFYSVLLFIPVYLLIFYSIDAIYVLNKWGKLTVMNGDATDLYVTQGMVNLFHPASNLDFITSVFFIFQAYAMLASIYFGKMSYIKGFVFVIVLILGISYFNGMLVQSIVSDQIHSSKPFSGGYIINSRNNYIQLPETLQSFWYYFFAIGLPLFLWFLAYLRLKEKEV